MRTFIPCTISPPAQTGTEYSTCNDIGQSRRNWLGSEPGGTVFNVPGTIKAIHVYSATAPGSGKSRVVTFRLDGSDSALAVTLSNTSNYATASADVSVSKGNRGTLKHEPSSTPDATADFSVTLEFEPTTAGEHPWCCEASIDVNSGFTQAPQGICNLNGSRGLVPTPGTVLGLRLRSEVSLGASESCVATLIKDGSSTLLAATVNSVNQEAENTVNSVTFSGGEEVQLEFIHFNGSVPVRFVAALIWAPTTQGEAVFLGQLRVDFYANSGYVPITSQNLETQDNETLSRIVIPYTCDLKKLYVEMNGAPGSGASGTFTGRLNGTDSSVSATITHPASTANNTANTLSMVAGDRLNLKKTTTGSPGFTQVYFGVVIAEAAVATKAFPFRPRYSSALIGR